MYDQLETIAKKLDLPKHYKTDLTVHDKRFLDEKKPDCFLWILYDCGTHIFNLSDNPTNKDLIKLAELIKGVFIKNGCFKSDQHVFWIEKNRITEITLEKAIDKIGDLIDWKD